MIFRVLELKLSQRYVGVDVWLWKVHPFQVNLQICWIKLKQKLSAKWHFELYLATPACLWSQNFQTWLGNIAHLLETWDKYLPVDSPTLFKRLIVYMQALLNTHPLVTMYTSWLPYSTYLYLDFHLLFYDKAKRTQQGNLLGHCLDRHFLWRGLMYLV